MQARAGGLGLRIDEIPWEAAAADGTRAATLVGNRLAGMFSYAFLIPAGVWDPPHSHIADAHLCVVSGALRLGYGTRLDTAAAAVHPAGSFLHVPAGAVHFDGALEQTILIGTALAPWSTDHAPSAVTRRP